MADWKANLNDGGKSRSELFFYYFINNLEKKTQLLNKLMYWSIKDYAFAT